MQDRSPQSAGADHGGGCGGGACAGQLFSLRLAFSFSLSLSLRPLAADAAAPGTLEPHGPKMAALGFLCGLRMPEVTAPPPPGVQPIVAAQGSRPGCCC